eukprot:5522493-Ditylum_brightwellii.AAC.1
MPLFITAISTAFHDGAKAHTKNGNQCCKYKKITTIKASIAPLNTNNTKLHYKSDTTSIKNNQTAQTNPPGYNNYCLHTNNNESPHPATSTRTGQHGYGLFLA